MKAFSIIFSIFSNLIRFVSAWLACVFGILCCFRIVPYVATIACAAVAIVFDVVVTIANKVEDKQLETGKLLKTKRALFVVAKFFGGNIFVTLIAALAGFGLIIVGCTLRFGVYTSESMGWVECIVGGISLFISSIFYYAYIDRYIDTHCKYCGGSFSGGSYQYEEEEREHRVDKNGKDNVTSKIRFEFVCPHCDQSTIYRRKLKTDAAAVEKFARSIIK